MASDAPAPEGTFAQVVEAAIAAGLAAALPVLAEAGITCIDDIRRGALGADRRGKSGYGVGRPVAACHSALATQARRPYPETGVEGIILGWAGGGATGEQKEGARQGMLARSSHQPVESRLMTWRYPTCMGGRPLAHHVGDLALHRRVVEGGQLPLRPELL